MPRRAVFFLLVLLAFKTQAQNGVLNTTVLRRGSQPLLQAVWQVEPRALHYRRVPGDSTITATYQTAVALTRGTDTLLRDAWQTTTPPVAPARASALTLLDLWSKPVTAGTYRVVVRVTEPGFERSTFTLSQNVVVPPVDTARVALSQPQLLDTFYRGGPATGIFAQGAYQVVPLAADFLADERRQLHGYVEAYSAGGWPATPLIWRLVVASRGAALPYTQHTDTVRAASDPRLSLLASLPAGAVPSGNYTLRATLEDATGAVLATSERLFQRSNATPDAVATTVADTTVGKPQPDLVLPDLKRTFVADFKPGQLPALLRMLLPITTPEEGLAIQTLLRNPDPDFVRPFVYQAFAQRNPNDPAAAWREYAEAVRTVNRLYRHSNTPGYETERGQVQLRYGPPDDRITVPAESGTLPYEVWLYNGLKPANAAAAFLFYQPGGPLDDYYLLHSTAPGETRNPQWRRYLYTQAEAGARSRAEQYFPTR